MQQCAICEILNTTNSIETIFDGTFWRVSLDTDQQYLGKSFVTLKRHAEKLSELTEKEAFELFEIIRRYEKSVETNWHPSHFNWSCLMNNAADTGNSELFHVHIHAIPRYDSVRNINQTKFVDQRFPKSARTLTPNLPSDDTLKSIAELLKSKF